MRVTFKINFISSAQFCQDHNYPTQFSGSPLHEVCGFVERSLSSSLSSSFHHQPNEVTTFSGPPLRAVRWIEPIPEWISGALQQVSGKWKNNSGAYENDDQSCVDCRI